MTDPLDAATFFFDRFGPGPEPRVISVPGRVNLIGEHIDYHHLPVLPMAIGQHVEIAFRPRGDRRVRAVSAGSYGAREFDWTPQLEPGAAGDWANYLKAAAQAVGDRWELHCGVDAAVVSNLPPGAGLASSSALFTAFALALLAANGVSAGFEQLMEVLPEGEYFVGTRGGGMDHAAVLASRPGSALLVSFSPLEVTHVPVPAGLGVPGSAQPHHGGKVGRAARGIQLTPARRCAGARTAKVCRATGRPSAARPGTSCEKMAGERLEGQQRGSFLHVTGEALRVREAVNALRDGDAEAFGQLLDASHASLRDLLRVSTPALEELVAAAREAGALGARLTGAGFGGCVVILCRAAGREQVRAELVRRYYSPSPRIRPPKPPASRSSPRRERCTT